MDASKACRASLSNFSPIPPLEELCGFVYPIRNPSWPTPLIRKMYKRILYKYRYDKNENLQFVILFLCYNKIKYIHH